MLQLRYLVYSDSHGIFLGVYRTQTVWSKSIPAGFEIPDGAPTFASEREFVDRLNDEQFEDAQLPTYRMVEAHPDLPGNKASKEACANAALPVW